MGTAREPRPCRGAALLVPVLGLVCRPLPAVGGREPRAEPGSAWGGQQEGRERAPGVRAAAPAWGHKKKYKILRNNFQLLTPMKSNHHLDLQLTLKRIVHFSIQSQVIALPQTGSSGAAGVGSVGERAGSSFWSPLRNGLCSGCHPKPSHWTRLFAGALLCCPAVPMPL